MAGRQDDISVNKAATDPHAAADSAGLVVEAVGAFLGSLAPLSAAARVVGEATRINLADVSTVRIPGRASPPAAGDVPWIEELAPIPVKPLPSPTRRRSGPCENWP